LWNPNRILPIWPDSGIFFSFIPRVCTRAYAHARTHARTHAARHSQRGNVRLDRARAARFTRVLNYTRLRDTGTEGVPPRLRRNRREGGGEGRLGPGPRACLVQGTARLLVVPRRRHRNQDRKLVYLRTVETNVCNVTALDSPARGIFTARRITFQYILLCRPRDLEAARNENARLCNARPSRRPSRYIIRASA